MTISLTKEEAKYLYDLLMYALDYNCEHNEEIPKIEEYFAYKLINELEWTKRDSEI